MISGITLLPYPRKIDFIEGAFKIDRSRSIQIQQAVSGRLRLAAESLSQEIADKTSQHWQVTTAASIPDEELAVQILIDPNRIGHDQGYQLEISSKRIQLIGNDEPGTIYGFTTLAQIISQSHASIPCINITDWPDFPVRGVLLDISRDKVYRLETLFMLVDELASWKINQVQLYTEHTFAYLGHEVVWENASPMTPDDINKLDVYCQERFIELVPNQNSLGHMNRWLKHPQYQHLAETVEPVMAPWGELKTDPFSLAPVLPESLAFVTSLYDELLPNFSSRLINVGCDEAFDIGAGRSKAACKDKGAGKVYLDYLLALHQDISEREYTMQFWGDIILQHPELVLELPQDSIALDWGYEADHPFPEETKIFQSAGIPFYVCPGTSSWNSLGGRVENALTNCQTASEQGLLNGAIGYLNTDWGDNGHWQQLIISYPGLAAGAAFSWCCRSNTPFDLEGVLNTLVFKDQNNLMGKILITIGNEYNSWGLSTPNSSPLFWLLQKSADELGRFKIDELTPIHETLERLNTVLSDLEKIQLNRSDARQIHAEIKLTVQLMKTACHRALWHYSEPRDPQFSLSLCEMRELIAEYKRLWLIRNRIGGLSDSLAHFDQILIASKAE